MKKMTITNYPKYYSVIDLKKNRLVYLRQKILTYNHILLIILFDFKGILSNQSLLEPIRHIPFKGK